MTASDKGEFDSTPLPAEARGLPRSLMREAGIILPLATSGFLVHFLEGFLDNASRWLWVPWWLVHAALCAASGIFSTLLVGQRKLFPVGGPATLWGILAAEYVFTTWMLIHIRQSRTLALVAVARLESGADRLTWMRSYFGPLHWGWVLRGKSGRAGPSKTICLRLPVLTLLLLLAFYVYLLLWGAGPGAHGMSETCYAHLPGLHTLIAKAAMLLAVLAHFWLLRGLVQLLRGTWPNSLTGNARLMLWAETRRGAIRLNIILGAATGIWMFVHGMALGITEWSWVLSVWVLGMFLTQGIIVGGHGLWPAARSGWRAVPGVILSIVRQAPRLLCDAEVWASALIITCPVAANCAGNVANKLTNL